MTDEIRRTRDGMHQRGFLTMPIEIREVDYLLGEIERLRTALVGADWIIKKLAPHETMAIMVRGYKPSDEDIATGTKYRKLIDDALAPQPGDAIAAEKE